MNREELITQTKRLVGKYYDDDDDLGSFAEACEFLRIYGGPRNSFLAILERHDPFKSSRTTEIVQSVLQSFLDYLEAGLHNEISPERRAQLDAVTDYLDMANTLLETKGVHSAAPAMLIGATLEEFLRNWVEAEDLLPNDVKSGIETYSQILRNENLITKQDGKDITSWAGIRNQAAHGEWDEVADKKKIMLMLEGVNLFMREYSHK